MSGVTYATAVIVHMTCGACGVHFGLDNEFIIARQADHRKWYCPNGHRLYWPAGVTEEEKLRRQLANTHEDLRIARADAEHERRSAAATRGHLTRMRRRIANGVCPCCTRSFVNVKRHMATQHPEMLRKIEENA